MEEVIRRIVNKDIAPGCYGRTNDGFCDHIDCVIRSWTYAKLTEVQKRAVISLLKLVHPPLTSVSDYEKDWDLCSEIYQHCLEIVGYQNGVMKSEKMAELKKQAQSELEKLAHLVEQL